MSEPFDIPHLAQCFYAAMILPHLARQKSQRRGRRRRQLGLGDVFTITDAKDDHADEETTRTRGRTTTQVKPSTSSVSVRPSSLTASTSSSLSLGTLSQASSSLGSSISTNISSSTSSTSITLHSTSVSTITPIETSSAASGSLIFPNVIPSDFPVPHFRDEDHGEIGRGYLILRTNQLADSMIIFGMSLSFFFIFSIFLVKCSRLLERRQGNIKVDGMVSADMRWAEGREVIEKRIVYEPLGSERRRIMERARPENIRMSTMSQSERRRHLPSGQASEIGRQGQ
ncbi:hypothetical protein BD324DRAFT_649991 [Kockovaella imperatae]|uniref:Uncharacterized protein n=1 Tax=Kockovaella imperatae TaxID=4999 RepID=A0A1Y1UKY9_9TREE|nr:hypothetical protein BD324DRAFT_649991 [Kockovaella imperatae]ORX38642.1 hypothetical protein BD324DRAFT_649991 [Kockovaella imperatae]